MINKTIGEILSIISTTMECYERSAKTYKKSIITGIMRYIVQALAYIFLAGINGAIITVMALIRYIFMYKKKFTGKVIYIWVIISITINIYFANVVTDLFPLIATLQFTFMVRKQNTISLKYAQIINSLIWSVYHIANRTYVYLIFDIILSIITIIRIKKGVED